MGYARTSQRAHGIHMRLRSRAYIMSQFDPSYPNDNSKSLQDDDLFESSAFLRHQRNIKSKATPVVSSSHKSNYLQIANPQTTV